jgi:hypothetical protein
MSRLGACVRGAVLLVAMLASGAASAQQPGAGAPMPISVDLAKVPIGQWADYSMSVASMAPMKMRLALVGKAQGSQTLEMSAEGGVMASAGGKMIVQTRITSDPKGGDPRATKVVMQLGDNDPMEMPAEAAEQSRFTKPDPKALVGEETVKVPAGTFKAKHYHAKLEGDSTLDYWIADKALPLGLVKMEGDPKTPGVPGPVKLELTALGKNAKQVITKTPGPFDPAKLQQQVLGAGAGAGKKK